MKTARILAALSICFAACVLHAQTTGPRVVQPRNMAEWRQTFKDYSKQSVDIKAQIQRELPEFSDRFLELVKELPEVKREHEFSLWISAELDNLMAPVNPPLTKEEVDVLRQKLNVLKRRADKFFQENPSSKSVARAIASDFSQVVRQGLKDNLAIIRTQAENSFQLVFEQRFRARRGIYRWLCGTRPELAQHRDIFNEAVSDLLRERVRTKPLAMIEIVRSKGKGFREALLAMAEARSPLVRPIIADLVQSKDKDEAELGLHCVINWPIPEALPWVIDMIKGDGEEDGNILQTTLVAFGEKGLRGLTREWKTVPEFALPLVFEALYDLPSQAALILLSEGAKDSRPEIRAQSAKALGTLIDAEWYEFFAGPDPRNLDRKRVLWLLNKLTRDPDEMVREAAYSALPSPE